MIANVQRLFGKTLAIASLTRHEHIGQKVHLDFALPLPTAGFAAPTRHIERKAARRIATQTGLGRLRQQTADIVIKTDIRGGV